jgi:hypothetical protein
MERNLWDLGQVALVAMFVVYHIQSTIQENWFSKRPIHQQRSVEELHCEETTFVGVFVGQYSPIARVVHLAENADMVHL